MSGEAKKKQDFWTNIVTYFEMKRAMMNSSATRMKKTPSNIWKIVIMRHCAIKQWAFNDQCVGFDKGYRSGDCRPAYIFFFFQPGQLCCHVFCQGETIWPGLPQLGSDTWGDGGRNGTAQTHHGGCIQGGKRCQKRNKPCTRVQCIFIQQAHHQKHQSYLSQTGAYYSLTVHGLSIRKVRFL